MKLTFWYLVDILHGVSVVGNLYPVLCQLLEQSRKLYASKLRALEELLAWSEDLRSVRSPSAVK